MPDCQDPTTRFALLLHLAFCNFLLIRYSGFFSFLSFEIFYLFSPVQSQLWRNPDQSHNDNNISYVRWRFGARETGFRMKKKTVPILLYRDIVHLPHLPFHDLYLCISHNQRQWRSATRYSMRQGVQLCHKRNEARILTLDPDLLPNHDCFPTPLKHLIDFIVGWWCR